MRSLPLFFLLACSPPHRDYTPDQIQRLDKLADVMDVQATVADPQLKKIDQGSYTEQDWAAFTDMGDRLQATSGKIHQFSKGPGFDALADRLHGHAEKLSAAAAAKDARAASETLAAIKATCKECHSKYR
jgi:cytochrome c556